mgnify:CR=1 FL=1
MNTILDIIKKYRSQLNKNNFHGDIYFSDDNGQLQIDRAVFNKMIDKVNSNFNEQILESNADWLLGFKRENFEDNSGKLFRMDRNYYRIALLDETALVALWSEETEGTEKKTDECDIIIWKEIENIDWYVDEVKGDFFRFFEKNSTDQIDLNLTRFGSPKKETTIKTLLSLFLEIIEFVNNQEQDDINQYNELKQEIENLFSEDKIKQDNTREKAFVLLEKFKNDYIDINSINVDADFYYYYKIASTEKSIQAIKIFEEYKRICDNANLTYDIDITNLIGQAYADNKDYLSAVNNFAYSLENSEIETKSILEENVTTAYAELKNGFSNIDYNKRKLIFISYDILHTSMDGMVVLKKDNLPQNIQFPLNHPKENEVYICHPINKNAYLPIKEFEKELFTDRLHELMLLLGSLGAKKIDISSQERNVNTENQKNNMQANASLDAKINSARGDYEKNSSEDGSLEHELNVKFYQIFNPKKAPFIPNNLVWYHSNLGWQRLANQRLNGNLLIHTEVISTKQVETLSTNEIKKLNAEITFLWGKAKAGGSYTNEIDFKSVTERNYTLEIAVEFEDIDNLQQVVSNENTVGIENKTTSNESYQQYAEEICFMLEDDGEIDEKERRVLERLRKNLGLSEEEAKQIEEEIKQLSQNEKEYLEEYQAIIADGEITERERRLLNRLSSSLGISEERIKELEK